MEIQGNLYLAAAFVGVIVLCIYIGFIFWSGRRLLRDQLALSEEQKGIKKIRDEIAKEKEKIRKILEEKGVKIPKAGEKNKKIP